MAHYLTHYRAEMKTLMVASLILLAPVWRSQAAEHSPVSAAKPNIVFILCDDLGYGDVHCLNPERGKIATPNIDKLASESMTFTDAHSTSAVCTPSRYGILTGRYNWRSTLQEGVLGAYGSTLIEKNQLTVAELLKQQGYATACIGKWHLGWQWPEGPKGIDFTQAIREGPTTRGFDYYFGVDLPNCPPYCFIENDHTVGIPTVPLPRRLLGNNLAGTPGPSLPDWSLEAILPTITDKACDFISNQAKAGKPFFLYLALTAPHMPVAPTKEWQGKSGLGPYGDFVMETDAMAGRVLAVIEKTGQADDTLVLLASDNGVAPYVGVGPGQLKQLEAQGFSVKQEEHSPLQRYKELEAMGHYSSYVFRGHKADIWDGGHRIPLFVRWPGKIKTGSTSGQLVSLADFMATCAEITGAKIPPGAAEDSFSLLPILLGTATAPIQPAVVFHSINGSFAIQQGSWKLELCPGSGGWGDPRPNCG
jgi:arylsulfatase A